MDKIGFCCPICGKSLIKTEHGAVCESGHGFDRARQGYYHLLPSNKMHSKVPGDTKEMVDSRRRFLSGGYYEIFRNKLCETVRDCAEKFEGKVTLLDAGCGEGYYTSAMASTLLNADVFGFDISKSAVKAAAGMYKSITFAVASSFSIPVKDDFCDILVNVFSPLAEDEFARIVRRGGYFIYAVPGERHLIGLKNILYDQPYENERKDTAYSGFEFVKRIDVRSEIEISDSETALDLFAMTPYYWKTGVDGGKRLAGCNSLTTEIEFDFLVYKRI